LKSVYLKRYANPNPLIHRDPASNLELIVTIPCYNEQSLIPCLNSIANCELPKNIAIEVLVIINESETENKDISERNEQCYQEAKLWAENYNSESLSFHILYEKLPKKHAGVGLARKLIMDEAARRFDQLSKPDGVIICYDADCICDTNYLKEVYNYFQHNKKCPGASIYFEHPTEGEYPEEIYQAIIDYELFLRYYVNALRFAGFPHAYETIGSSMSVRSLPYQKQGGMNKRKAGEDFYFLHKIIPLGNFGEINTTRVVPSPRKSDRVPFGTGRAVNEWLNNEELLTYSLQTFEDLKHFCKGADLFYKADERKMQTVLEMMPESIIKFLNEVDGKSEIDRINKNVASPEAFNNQFFRWFDGFKVLKFVHFARDNYYSNAPVFEVAKALIEKVYTHVDESVTSKQLLDIYREMDRLVKH